MYIKVFSTGNTHKVKSLDGNKATIHAPNAKVHTIGETCEIIEPTTLKTSIVIVSHINDGMIQYHLGNNVTAKHHMNFVKFLVLNYSKVNEIDPDAVYTEFTTKNPNL